MGKTYTKKGNNVLKFPTQYGSVSNLIFVTKTIILANKNIPIMDPYFPCVSMYTRVRSVEMDYHTERSHYKIKEYDGVSIADLFIHFT